MNTISPEQLLSQIRALQSEMNGVGRAPAETQGAGGTAAFSESLKEAVSSVNDAQMAAKQLKADYAAEAGDASLAEVMVAAQKADLSFRAMTEVRNKLVTAYQEIMNMPV